MSENIISYEQGELNSASFAMNKGSPSEGSHEPERQPSRERPISSYGRHRSDPRVDDRYSSRENAWHSGEQSTRPASSYGRPRRALAQQGTYDCNDNDISEKDSKAFSDVSVGKKLVRPKSSYGRRTPAALSSENTESGNSPRSRPTRPSSSHGRICRVSSDNSDTNGVSRGRPEPQILSARKLYSSSESATNRESASKGPSLKSSPESPDSIDCSRFSDLSHDNKHRTSETKKEKSFTDNVGHFVPRHRRLSNDSATEKNAPSGELERKEKQILDLYRQKHPTRKAFRLKPLKMKDRPLRSASEGDVDSLIDEIITLNCSVNNRDEASRLAKDKASPLGKLGEKFSDGNSARASLDSTDGEIDLQGPESLFTKNNLDSAAVSMRGEFSYNRSDVAGSHANETLLWIRDLPIEKTAKLGQLPLGNKAALIAEEGCGKAYNSHDCSSRSIENSAGVEETSARTCLTVDDNCKVSAQRHPSRDFEFENEEDLHHLSSPTPPKELPPTQRLSKLHARRIFRERGSDGLLPSYPVITANGKTIRASSSKDSDSSEPSTPTSPKDLNIMESKLERSGSQKNRGTPFTSNPPPQRPDSAASRPGTALADRPRTGQGSRSGSGREGQQRPARSIAQLKKLSSQEMDDLKDGRRSQLSRAQSLPEGGMGPSDRNKQSLSEMMEDIKECRYIRKQDSKE